MVDPFKDNQKVSITNIKSPIQGSYFLRKPLATGKTDLKQTLLKCWAKLRRPNVRIPCGICNNESHPLRAMTKTQKIQYLSFHYNLSRFTCEVASITLC